MEPLPSEPAEPGTLLWIGPTSHREFADAYRFCRQSAAQIAVRSNLHEAVARPAGYVRRIVFARPTRHMPPQVIWDRFTLRYRQIASLALCGSLCDGEGRTGKPWPAEHVLRFSRWSELLPAWLAPCGASGPAAQRAESLLVISDRFEMAEPYLQWAVALGVTTSWHRRFIPALHRGFGTVLWDDSSAGPAASATWQQRLGQPGAAGSNKTGTDSNPRHLWVALQPSIAEIQQALGGGITRVLTKPAKLDAVFSL